MAHIWLKRYDGVVYPKDSLYIIKNGLVQEGWSVAGGSYNGDYIGCWGTMYYNVNSANWSGSASGIGKATTNIYKRYARKYSKLLVTFIFKVSWSNGRFDEDRPAFIMSSPVSFTNATRSPVSQTYATGNAQYAVSQVPAGFTIAGSSGANSAFAAHYGLGIYNMYLTN